MKRLTSIVALNQQSAIGCQNQLPWRLKTDLQFFKSQTIGQTVVMGRRTLDSIGRELPGRHNIVLSHNSVLFPESENKEVAISIEEALVKIDNKKSKEPFIIGGASTYEQFSPFVDRYLITIVDKLVPNADAHFSENIFGNEAEWSWKKIEGLERNPETDDAEFEVFEVVSSRAKEIAAARNQAIEAYRSRYLNTPARRVSKGTSNSLALNLGLQF